MFANRKVCFFNKDIYRKVSFWASPILAIISIIMAFDINSCLKLLIGFLTLISLVIFYIWIWCRCNNLEKITLKINNSLVEVKFGDIFSENAPLKAIAFNEYFDTLVDDEIIAKQTLNGKYLDKIYGNNTKDLDERILNDDRLIKKQVGTSGNRKGKKIKYPLGTIFKDNGGYLLTAFSRFDDENKAYLETNDYINCLLNFWNEVDRIYAGNTLVLPVFGSGITRFKTHKLSDQELLELLLWTFKISMVDFTHPAKIIIMVWSGKKDKVNLFKLIHLFKL